MGIDEHPCVHVTGDLSTALFMGYRKIRSTLPFRKAAIHAKVTPHF
ncbi:MAG: hypothetical protein ACREJ0_07795 [Geminicoccaceae bacterium]